MTTPKQSAAWGRTRVAALLKTIAETKPESISALAEATGRKPGNLSRTLNEIRDQP